MQELLVTVCKHTTETWPPLTGSTPSELLQVTFAVMKQPILSKLPKLTVDI